MKRPASGEKNLERIQSWRDACPEIVIRSTFIAGFPGETEAQFQHLLDFMPRYHVLEDRLTRVTQINVAGWNTVPVRVLP